MKLLLQNSLRSLSIAIFGLMLVSCAGENDNIENRGYIAKFSDFSKIKVGSSTKGDVMRELGSPSTTSMFGSETWFYIGKEQTKETFFKPEVKTYDAYGIEFNKSGVVSAINKKDKNSLKEFAVSDDFTRTSGSKITIWQQLLGNIGRFSPAERGGVSTGVTPGSKKPGGY